MHLRIPLKIAGDSAPKLPLITIQRCHSVGALAT
jgi:hypothetical protein